MHFVLVHGGFHGGWCWDKVAAQLRASGHSEAAPDLPGMGTDTTPHSEVTLASTAAFMADAVRAQPCPVVLVGHSMGGMVIAEVAELIPDAILGLVFVTAVLRTTEATPPATAEPPPMTPSADGRSVICDATAALETFYNTTDTLIAQRAVAKLTPQPIAAMIAPATATLERFGRVPRAFIECTQDRVIPLAHQQAMQAALPCDPVFTLDTDHSPFLSAPDHLAECLVVAAAQFDRPPEPFSQPFGSPTR